MKTIIAGSRSFTDYDFIEKAIKNCGFQITEVVCGEARGVDALGRKWGERHGVHVQSFPADWDNLDVPGAIIKTNRLGKQYNAKAGYDRNHQMADYAEALIAIWNGKSPGTRSMILLARDQGMIVKVFVVASCTDA